ncbi:MAG: cytochrome c peroxidase [Bacteroidota bacterium]
MKRYFYFLFAFLPLLFAPLFFSFQGSWEERNAQSVQAVHTQFLKDWAIFQEKIDQTIVLAKELYDFEEVEQMRLKFLEAREAYKRAEFLAAFVDEEYILRYINGAPLPKIDPQAADATIVVDPKGMQVIDEMIFAEDAESQQYAILKKLHELKKNATRFYEFESSAPMLENRQIFEASRQALIRVMSLGLTGFDTPASAYGIQDSREVFVSLRGTLRAYEGQLIEVDPDLYFELDQTYGAAITYLKQNQRFDKFDRAHFIKSYLQPLYAGLKQAHLSLQYQTIYDVSPLKQSTNYFADDIFSDDFLNPNFYTSQESDETEYPARQALGKLLFYDPILSQSKTMACASCHQADKAFTDGETKSLAADGISRLDRNAPTVVNALYGNRFFHDLRSGELSHQMDHVIYSDEEFHTDYATIFATLNQSEEYQKLFKEAFPGQRTHINAHTFQTAMTAYIRSLRSFNSAFDRYMRGELAEIDPAVLRGFNLFMGEAACGTCHFAPVFNGTVPPKYHESESEVLGVPEDPYEPRPRLDPDMGRYENQRLKEKVDFNRNAFKTPTVRNIALTAPYMHNGAYEKLEDVMDFYNKGGGIGLGLRVPNQTLPSDLLNLKDDQISDIIVFMEALTDTTGMTTVPERLPLFQDSVHWNNRPIGGSY